MFNLLGLVGLVESCRVESNSTLINSEGAKGCRLDISTVNVLEHVVQLVRRCLSIISFKIIAFLYLS